MSMNDDFYRSLQRPLFGFIWFYANLRSTVDTFTVFRQTALSF